MVEAAPAASLVVPKAEFLFQLLVIALDAPAPRGLDPGVGQIDQALERGVGREGGQPVLGGLGLALGPFDQQPFLTARLGPPRVAMGCPPPNPGKARCQRSRGSFAPGNRLPACRRQVEPGQSGEKPGGVYYGGHGNRESSRVLRKAAVSKPRVVITEQAQLPKRSHPIALQVERKRLDTDRMVLGVAAHQLRATA